MLRLDVNTNYKLFRHKMDDRHGVTAEGESNGESFNAVRNFDARLIAEYDGTEDVVEWFTRTEMLCELNSVPIMSVLPLRLTGGAFAVWAQLPVEKRKSLEHVRSALFSAFAMDQYAAYEAFSQRQLKLGESVDVYLADLRRLARLFGGIPERALACAFINGLPDSTRQTIRAGSKAEDLSLADVLARSRAVLSDERVVVAAVAARARPAPDKTARRLPPPRQATRQSVMGNAPVRAPPSVGEQAKQDDQPAERGAQGYRLRRCWICGVVGHISFTCPQRGNGNGEDASAPPSSPRYQ